MKPTETKLGTISKVGSWTISLEITRCTTAKRARYAGYVVAAKLAADPTLEDFDVRFAELPPGSSAPIAVMIEVDQASSFTRARNAIERAVEHARAW
jgi:hypothetical protein